MDQQPSERPSQEPPNPRHGFFDVYKVAIDDLHRTKSLAQKIDSLYLTIITLLLTADAYEIATSKFNGWVPVAATAGVAFIGLAVTARWRQGAGNLFRITTYRYIWLREAEDAKKHPEMGKIGANIFTQEYDKVYKVQMNKKKRARIGEPQDPTQTEPGFSMFYHRTVFLQTLCLLVFVAVPVILAVATYVTLTPSVFQPIERIISGK